MQMIECCYSLHLFRDAGRCFFLCLVGMLSARPREKLHWKEQISGLQQWRKIPSWAVRCAEFCCECHKGKDSQGSYWRRGVKRDKLQVTYCKSNDQVDSRRKAENLIVPGFCFLEAMETFLALCTVLNIILTPDFMTYAFII